MKTFKQFNETNESKASDAIDATTLIINKDDFEEAVKLLAKAGIQFMKKGSKN